MSGSAKGPAAAIHTMKASHCTLSVIPVFVSLSIDTRDVFDMMIQSAFKKQGSIALTLASRERGRRHSPLDITVLTHASYMRDLVNRDDV